MGTVSLLLGGGVVRKGDAKVSHIPPFPRLRDIYTCAGHHYWGHAYLIASAVRKVSVIGRMISEGISIIVRRIPKIRLEARPSQ